MKKLVTSDPKCLLLGFGDILKRLSPLIIERYNITGVRRSAGQFPQVRLVKGDCSQGDFMKSILSVDFDTIVITMTPDEFSDEGYQRAYVQPVKVLLETLMLTKQSPRLIILVSSTSVYGQQEGEWVDENSPTAPTHFSGQRLLEAEKWLQESNYPSCVVRFSGIYGPSRNRLIEQVKSGYGTDPEPVLFSNRIHADDCARVLAHLMCESQLDSDLYLATDCEPAPMHEVKQWLAQQLDLPPGYLQPKALKRNLRSSKRCSNRRLLATGFRFLYPTYRDGYGALLADKNNS